MKEKTEKYLIYSLILLGGFILVFTYFNLSNTVEDIAQTILHEKKDQTEVKLDQMFEPVVSDLNIAVDQAKRGEFDRFSLQEFNQHFLPILKESDLVSSIMMATEQGKEFMLLDLDSIIINRKTSPISKDLKLSSTKYKWKVSERKLKLLEKTAEGSAYNPRWRPWFLGAIRKRDKIYWTNVYTFFTTKDPGITVSKRWVDLHGMQHVIAFDLMLLDISRMSTSFHVSSNGSLFILNDEFKVLGLPSELKESEFKANVLKPVDTFEHTPMYSAFRTWKNSEGRNTYFPFEHNGKGWWCVFQPYHIGNQTFYIGIVAPESDFLESIKSTRSTIFGSLLILTLFLSFVILANKRKRKMNGLLKEKNILIEVKSKEITDSIKYASQIQNAILPPDSTIQRLLPDSFVLYLPKDIVAGDFYWLQESENYLLFAACDCTGHGVPGAMVSVMCNNGLNRSVKEFGLTDPGQILDKTKELLIEEFEQSDREVKDGMDIALVSIEQVQESNSDSSNSKLRLSFAGANNPLWLIRKGSEEVEVTKPDKQPVGNFSVEKPFTTHHLEVQKGDMIYVFSDGYADQFGGSKGKKFKAANLKKLLLSIKDLPMEEQKKVVHKTFEDWKADNEQIDDVCVIGVKL